ncbi:BatA domain-containing protein [Rhodohalobacter barkolensis]|uniref:VWFA domain-containing protein n=1 Tax=Rhodohalobacter barkolensis TaxID=2053187 RepID=A0A2N0VI02_9BACT|nr:BatA domain-containing protein [Rhodohalobacter barkolensis]PKD43823.1 hypothetical protein CWD77_09715 [Rhodohalobacter barkolensis]
MSFLNPLFLIALVAAAIPLLIYLLNVRKPKKVLFSTLAFFDSLKQSALKRLKLKRLLLLAVRILAVLMLVLAAARPQLPGGFGTAGDEAPKAIAILLDNSPSMEQIDQNGPYFDQAKQVAEELISMSDSDDQILLNVTNGEILSLPFQSASAVLTRLPDLSNENKGNFIQDRLRDAIQRLEQAPEPNKWIYIITDGQESQLQPIAETEFENFEDMRIQFITLGNAEPSNTGIENVELESSSTELSLRSQVRNYGTDEAQNQFLSFIVDGELVSQQAIQISPGESQEFIFPLTETNSSNISAELLIEGDELTFDNRFFAAIELPEQRDIAVISDQRNRSGFDSYLVPVLEVMAENEDRFSVSFFNFSELETEELNNYDAIILDGLRSVPDYLSQTVLDVVQRGGGALLMPAADGDINSYNRLLGFGSAGMYTEVEGSYGSFEVIDRMAEPEEGHPIIDTIFEIDEGEQVRLNVPEIFYSYRIELGSGRDVFPVLSTRAGSPLLVENRVGNGKIIFSAIGSDPGWSNFPVKPFFAPLFFRTVEYLTRGEGAKLNSFSLGSSFETVVTQSIDRAEIEKEGETVVPDVRQRFEGTQISYLGREWSPGFGTVELNDQELLFSMNQNAMESVLNSLNSAEVEARMKPVFENVQAVHANEDMESFLTELKSASFGKEIWFWFIITAIILLITESVISRFYKIEAI